MQPRRERRRGSLSSQFVPQTGQFATGAALLPDLREGPDGLQRQQFPAADLRRIKRRFHHRAAPAALQRDRAESQRERRRVAAGALFREIGERRDHRRRVVRRGANQRRPIDGFGERSARRDAMRLVAVDLPHRGARGSGAALQPIEERGVHRGRGQIGPHQRRGFVQHPFHVRPPARRRDGCGGRLVRGRMIRSRRRTGGGRGVAQRAGRFGGERMGAEPSAPILSALLIDANLGCRIGLR
ncbi:hypothetical protein LzC2_41810 [Planctomycetes bacterium LzC2]|uniref:Uncharacterized protein n=1 Tax=Alienimonas chondri TaxID=2681879 RepID=A0ABX1VL53_9PLAN|nr:hypothetical protein [Alienimonas chondri]